MDWIEVIKAHYLHDYILQIEFNNGAKKQLDFAPLIRQYPAFRPLSDMNLFRSFTISDDTLEWMNGTIDIAPEYLYQNSI